jgi:hypothetical protein
VGRRLDKPSLSEGKVRSRNLSNPGIEETNLVRRLRIKLFASWIAYQRRFRRWRALRASPSRRAVMHQAGIDVEGLLRTQVAEIGERPVESDS